jgi:hypothetical protein
MDANEFCRLPVWYPVLAGHTFLTSFVKLNKDEISALANGETKGKNVRDVIKQMALPMKSIPGNSFVSVDTVAPTDTDRFKGKRGAVYSPESAWRYLAKSQKVRAAAAEGKVEYVCMRPFRRMNQTREFRLFIYNRELKAMSQYWLVRHFRRLEGPKKKFWKDAKNFVEKIIWLLPVENIVMDIYFTSDNDILIIDLNPWGGDTSPLMLHTWDRDWNEEIGIQLMPPPTKISGNVNVSF